MDLKALGAKFEGKKTKFAAGLLLLIAGAGYGLGALDQVNALAIATAALGVFGLGAKSDRYAKQVLSAIDDLKQQQAKPGGLTSVAVIQEVGAQIARSVGDGTEGK